MWQHRVELRLQQRHHTRIDSHYQIIADNSLNRVIIYRRALRAEINRLRNRALTATPRQPAAERMSQASRDELHATLRHQVTELRRENQALRTRLAATLGEQRGQIHQSHSPVNHMSPTT